MKTLIQFIRYWKQPANNTGAEHARIQAMTIPVKDNRHRRMFLSAELSIFWVVSLMPLRAATNMTLQSAMAPTDLALVAGVETITNVPDVENPGREAANYLKYDLPKDLIPILKKEIPATEKEVREARKFLAGLSSMAGKGATWPKPGVIRIPRACVPPVIDGRVGETEWINAIVFRSQYLVNATNRLDSPATTWRILWDSNCLYFAFSCMDTDIVTPYRNRDEMVFFGDCVEMFILPDFRLGIYWEIVVSPSGVVFDALQSKKFRGWGTMGRVEQDIAGLRIGTRVDGTPNEAGDDDTGYDVEVAVPFRELPTYTRGNPPAPGDILHLMVVRLDQNGTNPLKAYAFKPLLSWGHNIWNHVPAMLAE